MKKDPNLASLELELELKTGAFLDLKLVPEGPFYTLEVRDRGTEKELDLEIFTIDPLPDIYSIDDLNQSLAILFQDHVTDVSSLMVTDENEIAEWVAASSLEQLETLDEVTAFFRGVDYVVNDLASTALYDSIGRSGTSLYCQYNNIVVEVNFRLMSEESND